MRRLSNSCIVLQRDYFLNVQSDSASQVTFVLNVNFVVWDQLFLQDPNSLDYRVVPITDKVEVLNVYENVRNDSTQETWALLGYDGKQIVYMKSGVDYNNFLAELTDDARNYAYVRFEYGDEMNKQKKFAFITWIGPGVSPLKKAKVSTDKAFVKEIWNQFGKEILADDESDLKYDKVRNILEAASGAAYGTGK